MNKFFTTSFCMASLPVLLGASLIGSSANAGQRDRGILDGAYAIESQMVLPHMEEMRRIYKSAHACIRNSDAAQLFPVFHQRAFTGCTLALARQEITERYYVLECNGVNGPTGTATLTLFSGDPDRIKGEFAAKIGGKNMTFFQYIDARKSGRCEPD